MAALLVPLAGCGGLRPVERPKMVIPETVPSQVRVAARADTGFGDLTPIAIGMSNGSKDTYLVGGQRVLAIDTTGDRVAALSVEEAIRIAGGSTKLYGGLKDAGAGALIGGVLGAATGAAIGAATGNAGAGAAIGAGVGAAGGSITGGVSGAQSTEDQTRGQLRSISLREQKLEPGLPVSGFAYFPRGEYVGVRVLGINQRTQAVEEFGATVDNP